MKKITISDVLFLIALTLWIYTLDFNALTKLQSASLVVFGLWLGFIVYRLIGKHK
ncbi:MAG: hypothetical protein PHC92_08250 [Syntrophomonadaceae bacterium]|nr:hypothetical protein [Syntrophomonadaceae bacterium]